MIEKPSIIITSIGRTGTKFFQPFFETIIPQSTTLHEPDVLNIVQYTGLTERIKRIIQQINDVGVSNMIVRKSLGRWSLSKLSDARVKGELEYAEAVQEVLYQRKRFVNSCQGTVYVETNAGCYGLIDVFKDVYQYHRVVYIVRDGREWVRSWLNWGEMLGMSGGMYGKRGLAKIFGRTWPTASDMTNDLYSHEWYTMSEFEKVCWAWAKLNDYALGTVQQNSDARMFRFEDIFWQQNRYQHLSELVNFVTNFSGTAPIRYTGSLQGWLEKQIHKSTASFPAWDEWSSIQKRQFESICGPLMDKLGYEIN